MKKILFLLAFLLLFAGIAQAEQATEAAIIADSNETPIHAYFFYSTGCPHCANAEAYLLQLEAKYPDLEIRRINSVSEPALLVLLYEKYSVPQSVNGQQVWGLVPVLFIGDQYFIGDTPIIQNLENEIIQYLETGVEKPDKIDLNAGQKTEVSLLQLVGLAIVDAINPCEIAILVLLMAVIISRFPNQKAKALKAGLAFSAAIFLMYFVFGLAIIFGFKALGAVMPAITLYIRPLIAIVAVILGILEIKDAVSKGRATLDIPNSWRPTIMGTINSVAKKEEDCPGCETMKKPGVMGLLESKSLILGSFAAGLIVSFALTPCTAGPYFVAGGILSQLPIIAALPYLLLYLLIFIAPMVLITLVTYAGFVAIEDVSGWKEKNLKKMHWIAGLLLLAIGIAMLAGFI